MQDRNSYIYRSTNFFLRSALCPGVSTKGYSSDAYLVELLMGHGHPYSRVSAMPGWGMAVSPSKQLPAQRVMTPMVGIRTGAGATVRVRTDAVVH